MNNRILTLETIEMKTLTIGQIRRACVGRKYILLRHKSMAQVGINCSVLWLDIYKKRLNTEVTQFVSFRECGINEYINCKIPY
jgi:hypothetical protein